MNLQAILSPQQIKILKLKQQGYKNREIAELMETTKNNIDQQMSKIKKKIGEVKKLTKNDTFDTSQYHCAPESFDEIAAIMEETPGQGTLASGMTVNEFQVLSLTGKGLTVKQAAQKTGKSIDSFKAILKRKGISAKDFKKHIISPEEAEIIFKDIGPESLPSKEDIDLLRRYNAGGIKRVDGAGVEVILRSAGLARRTKYINKGNATTLITLIEASRGRKIFNLREEDAKLIEVELQHYKPKAISRDPETKVTKLSLNSQAYEAITQAIMARRQYASTVEK